MKASGNLSRNPIHCKCFWNQFRLSLRKPDLGEWQYPRTLGQPSHLTVNSLRFVLICQSILFEMLGWRTNTFRDIQLIRHLKRGEAGF